MRRFFFSPQGVEDGALLAVDGGVADLDLGGHLVPALVLEAGSVVVLEGESGELDIRGAALHELPPGHEGVLGHAVVPRHQGGELHHLPVVLLEVLHQVLVEEGVVLVLHLHDGRVHVEGQGVDDLVVLGLAAVVAVGDVRRGGPSCPSPP